MTSVNTNTNPSNEQPYTPPGQSQVLTNTADTTKLETGPGGATITTPRDQLIPTTQGGIFGTTPGTTTQTQLDPNRAPINNPLLQEAIYSPQGEQNLANLSNMLLSLFGMSPPPSDLTTDSAPPGSTTGEAGPETADASLSARSFDQIAGGTMPQDVGGVAPPPAKQELTADDLNHLQTLHSTDSGEVYAELCAMAGIDPNESSDSTASLKALAAVLAGNNKSGGLEDLSSIDPAVILSALQNISGGTSIGTLTALKTIADKLAGINVSYEADINSTDSEVVFRALSSKVNLKHGHTEQEAAMTTDALKILSKALAYMSQIRSLLATLESKFTAELAKTKLNQVEALTRLTLDSYQKGVENLKEGLEKMHKQIAKQRLMKWLMPLIIALVTIVSVAITILTGGAATALGIGMICATIALAAFSIADSACGLLDKMCDKMNIKNDVLRAIVKMLVLVAMTVVTCGAGALAGAASAAAKIGATIATQIGANVTKSIVMGIVGLGLQCLFSSGFITSSLMALLTAFNVDEEKASIIAMALTIVIMIGTIAATMGTISVMFKGAAQTASTAATAGKDAGLVLEEATTEAAEQGTKQAVATATKAGVDVGTDAVSSTISSAAQDSAAVRTISNAAQRLKDAFKDPVNYVKCLGYVSSAMSVGANIYSAQASFVQGKISLKQAALEKEMADLNALIGMLQQLMPGMDNSINKLQDSSKQFGQQVADMMSFFSELVMAMSQITNKATQRG